MGELLRKPYEISVWEDKLTQYGSDYRFEEVKLAVIGSNEMTGPNKAYDPVFNKKSNGEKTLSFSLKYKYFDPYSGNEEVVNPFVALLINERKIKLHYDNKWYEFIIKDHSESSDEYTWTYTCTDAFVLELSKTGYNLTFDAELNNNQGTARELTTKVLENTDWKLGGANVGRQLIEEPVYLATLVNTDGISIINTDGTSETVGVNTPIYLFYSYVSNQDGKFVQFIIRDNNRPYLIDDNNVITDTNFRINTDLEYKLDGFYKGNTKIISWSDIETQYHVNRLAYGQLTTYDPVMGRTVDRFKVSGGDLEVYKYTDYTYTTSNVIMNYVTNGDNFNVLEDGTLQGWNPYVEFVGQDENDDTVDKLELVTRPELGTDKVLVDLESLFQIEGFLKATFKGQLTQEYQNAIYNSGFENNSSFIGSITQGEQFLFRWRAGVLPAGDEDLTHLVTAQGLRAIVAKYEQDEPTRYGYYYKHIDPNGIILEFKTDGQNTPVLSYNYIKNGTIEPIYIPTEDTEIDSNKTYYIENNDAYEIIEHSNIVDISECYECHYEYVIDGVVQTPSTKYVYKDKNTEIEYVWSVSEGDFILLEGSNYLPYYYLTTRAQKAVSSKELTDPTDKKKIGIFLYTADGNNVYYIQDVQLTRYIADATGQPILTGNIPVATSNSRDYYYIKPKQGAEADDVDTYDSLEALAEDYGIQPSSSITPLYNEGSEKVLSISAAQSNCFNILQTIAETFECWIDLSVEHDSNGYILRDEDGRLQKYVYLKEYAGNDNYAGFRYGINLSSIERTVNSDEIVTKLIVDQSQSDYVEEGYVSITNSSSNPSGESYILNFDYYYNQGLLDRESVEEDKNKFIKQLKDINSQLKEKEKIRIDLENSFVNLESKRTTFTELVDSAENQKNQALADFESLTGGETYEDYKNAHPTIAEEDRLTEDDTIFDILGELYVSSATINNYVGLLSNIETEYWEVREKLRGNENYSVKVWVDRDDSRQRHLFVELNDYLPTFSFTLGDDSTSYESTVSKKYFDITTEETVIHFTLPSDCSFEDGVSSSYSIIDSKVAKFSIIKESTIKGIEEEIEELIEEKNQLTKEFNNKYSRYIQEGTWNSTDYLDAELYYLDALQVSNTSAQPSVSYTINVVEISQLEGFEWYLFDAGDKSYIEDTEFFGWAKVHENLTPAREEVIVSEVEWHLDEPDKNTITVQNYKTRFEDLFQRISAAVQTVQYNEATYAKISSILDANGIINQDVLLQSLNNISGKKYNLTTDGSIGINGDEILIRNLTNSANLVKINSEGIQISSDGGLSWATAIDGHGINLGVVTSGSINTNQVLIGNEESYSFRWDKSGISAYKSNQNGAYDLQTYVRYDEYGLYGIKEGNGTFKAQSLQDVLDRAHFAVTWDGFFIKNSYSDGGRVSITSDDDFQVIDGNNNERIKIGSWVESGTRRYGIKIKNAAGTDTFYTDDATGNVNVTGTINATGGNFTGIVNVGATNQDHIIIDGTDASIKSSTYSDGAGNGWLLTKEGDAYFNNITARGAIKTAVFEYAEIQAVGGIFIFRPSSTIRSARVGNPADGENANDLIVTVEKTPLFKVGQWCKISNYSSGNGTSDGEATNPDAVDILLTNGLTHVYPITDITDSKITLGGAIALLNAINKSADVLIGGALVDMGNKAGTSNYGIGVNSSDNTVNLPARAISLFETVIDETHEPKVNYRYKGILGTLPVLEYSGQNAQVSALYHNNLEGTQGIYTDNIYIGDHDQYLTYYTVAGTNQKQLKIRANQFEFEVVDPNTGESEWKNVEDAADGEDAIYVIVDSTAGNFFQHGQINTYLVAHVYQGSEEITSQFNTFHWYRRLPNGNVDPAWRTDETSNLLQLTTADVDERAVFVCEVTIDN